jgi:glyoxylase-like metal-dependent hydrolase (beta-lactamase superfamily II)
MHTPGHTGDHLCLFDEECGLVISGDHVLPNITPHISGMTLARDPLKRFFASLDKMARLGDTVRLALPAHGNPFDDLAGRCMQIREHHEGRLDKIRGASVDFGRGPRDRWQTAKRTPISSTFVSRAGCRGATLRGSPATPSSKYPPELTRSALRPCRATARFA